MLKEQINKDFIAAFKAKSPAKSLLSVIKGEIQTMEKNTGVENLSDAEVTKILLKFSKGIKQNIELGSESAKAELEIVEGYLPKQMSQEEIQAKIDEIVAGGATHIGQIMKEFATLPADKKLVSQLARTAIA